MIKNNALCDRLNAIKYGEEIPTPPNLPNQPILPTKEHIIEEYSKSMNDIENSLYLEKSIQSKIITLIYYIIDLGYISLKTLAYGYGIKTILNADWSVFGFLSVGFIIEILTSELLSKFKNKTNEKG